MSRALNKWALRAEPHSLKHQAPTNCCTFPPMWAFEGVALEQWSSHDLHETLPREQALLCACSSHLANLASPNISISQGKGTDLLQAVAAAASRCPAKLHCRPTTDASRLTSLQEAARQGHCEITLPDPLPDCLDFEVLTLVGLPGALLSHHSEPLRCSLPTMTPSAAHLPISMPCRIVMHAACQNSVRF